MVRLRLLPNDTRSLVPGTTVPALACSPTWMSSSVTACVPKKFEKRMRARSPQRFGRTTRRKVWLFALVVPFGNAKARLGCATAVPEG